MAAKAEVKKDLNEQNESIQERLRKRKEEQSKRLAAKKNVQSTKNIGLKTFNFDHSPDRFGGN